MTALLERLRGLAKARARERATEMIEHLGSGLPAGIGAEAAPEGIALHGRGLRRRLALEPELRWLIPRLLGELKDRIR